MGEVKGFWGDMSVGPYCGLGIDVRNRSENEGLFEIHDRGHATERRRHNATEIAMFNLLADLYATEKGEQYALDRKNDVFSGLGSYLRKDRDALDRRRTSSSRWMASRSCRFVVRLRRSFTKFRN